MGYRKCLYFLTLTGVKYISVEWLHMRRRILKKLLNWVRSMIHPKIGEFEGKPSRAWIGTSPYAYLTRHQ